MQLFILMMFKKNYKLISYKQIMFIDDSDLLENDLILDLSVEAIIQHLGRQHVGINCRLHSSMIASPAAQINICDTHCLAVE